MATQGIPMVVPAPAPLPRPYNLLSVIPMIGDAQERWVTGVTVDRYRLGAPVVMADRCTVDQSPVARKPRDRRPGANEEDTNSFVVLVGLECTGSSIADNKLDEFEAQVRTDIEAIESQGVESEVMTGAVTGGVSFQSSAQLAEDGAHTLIEGLGILEREFGAEIAQRGILHLSELAFAHLSAFGNVLVERSGRIETLRGTPVVVSAAYDGSEPEDAAADTNDALEEFIYMTGMLNVRRTELWFPAGTVAEALDLINNQNTAQIYAERWYNVVWDHDAVFAIQVTRPTQ